MKALTITYIGAIVAIGIVAVALVYFMGQVLLGIIAAMLGMMAMMAKAAKDISEIPGNVGGNLKDAPNQGVSKTDMGLSIFSPATLVGKKFWEWK